MRKGNLIAVGKPLPRVDAKEKVLGNMLYADDYEFGGMLYGATVRAEVPRGIITDIDIEPAQKLPGVIGIYTHRDIPGTNTVPLIIGDYPFLAKEEVLFAGQPIALVAATSAEIARLATKKVVVKYQELPPLLDIFQALDKNSPRIYGQDNIFKRFRIVKGNVEKAFKQADVLVEAKYQTNYQVHSYLETQGMIAVAAADSGMTVYGSMQCPFYVHDAVAAVMGVPYNKVRIVQTTTGGAFGGKEDVPSIVAAHAALLAHLTRRPVKISYSREEDFISTSKRHPGYVEIKYGARKNGKIIAAQVKYIIDSGAFATLSPIVLWRGTVHAVGPYDIANVLIESMAVATNKVPSGAFRGFGQPQVCFANESLIDELAVKLGFSPKKLREINALKIGDTTATNQKITHSCGLKKVINEVSTKAGWDKIYSQEKIVKGTYRRGIGMSVNFYGVGLGAGGRSLDRAGAYVQIQKDATTIVAMGNTEMGQGALTVLAQIAAETLGVPYKSMKILPSDTTRVPDSGPTVASRTTLMSGNAIVDASKKIRYNIDNVVRKMLGMKKTGEILSDGKYYFVKGQPKKKMPYLEVIKKCHSERVNLAANGWYVAEETSFSENGQGIAYPVYTYSAVVAIVKVNTETGEVIVEKIVSGHDIGRAINPQQAEGQIQGGVLQGLGYALLENLVLRDGKIINPNFSGYLIPTTEDVPEIIPVIVEEKYPFGPYGAKGLGEPPLIGVAPAIVNAIYHATGWRVRQLPASPEMLLKVKDFRDCARDFNQG
jgi:CO/xanthine dehydrogenase Mo-binding subunit